MNSWVAPFTKLARQVSERGVKGTLIQMYTVGDLKFGTLKGVDKFGNKYYEDLDLPFGQHRWIEYSNIHDFDATMIQPEWHGWLHHTYDETPDEVADIEYLKTTTASTAIFNTNYAYVHPVSTEQVNQSQYRQRGYKVGSLMTGPEDPDLYYKQPGHPLSPLVDKGGRFQYSKGINVGEEDQYEEVKAEVFKTRAEQGLELENKKE